MNGLTSYVVGGVLVAAMLGSYVFSWNLFGYIDDKITNQLNRIDDKITWIFKEMGGKEKKK